MASRLLSPLQWCRRGAPWRRGRLLPGLGDASLSDRLGVGVGFPWRQAAALISAGHSTARPIHLPALALTGCWMGGAFNGSVGGAHDAHPRLTLHTASLVGRSQSRGYRPDRTRGPDMRGCRTIGELTQMASGHLQSMSTRDVAAFWTLAAKFLDERRNLRLDHKTANQMDAILCHTLEVIKKNIDSFHPRDLAQTAIALAKIMKIIEDREDRQGRLQKGSPHQLLHSVFIGNQSQNKQFIMEELALAAMPMREEFDARHLSNVIYAFGLARYALQFDDGRTTFDVLAEEALPNLSSFNGQDLSNMLWAHANAKAPNPALFRASADVIVGRDSLETSKPQELINTIWAYATLDEPHPELFERIADHIVAFDSLQSFDAQALSNTVWAYARAKETHQKLFKRIADHIVSLDNLIPFDPQHLSNTVWAYATLEESHPALFKKVADHIVSLDNLSSFKPQALSNTVWAYATARQSHPALFTKVADAAIKRRSELIPQQIANLLWAFASNGETHPQLFEAFAPTAAALVDKDTAQGRSNLAWAYAVANVDAPSLFNDAFSNACVAKEGEFGVEALLQLHQWNLWREELKSDIRLPPTLAERCHDAFLTQEQRASALQDDVIAVLSSIDLHQEEEFLTERGYRLDALVEVGGSKIGIEVDGPTHFVGRKPTGSTVLKHRQVAALDDIPVISVPYWKWDNLGKAGKNREKKQHYLRSLLDTK